MIAIYKAPETGLCTRIDPLSVVDQSCLDKLEYLFRLDTVESIEVRFCTTGSLVFMREKMSYTKPVESEGVDTEGDGVRECGG